MTGDIKNKKVSLLFGAIMMLCTGVLSSCSSDEPEPVPDDDPVVDPVNYFNPPSAQEFKEYAIGKMWIYDNEVWIDEDGYEYGYDDIDNEYWPNGSGATSGYKILTEDSFLQYLYTYPVFDDRVPAGKCALCYLHKYNYDPVTGHFGDGDIYSLTKDELRLRTYRYKEGMIALIDGKEVILKDMVVIYRVGTPEEEEKMNETYYRVE